MYLYLPILSAGKAALYVIVAILIAAAIFGIFVLLFYKWKEIARFLLNFHKESIVKQVEFLREAHQGNISRDDSRFEKMKDWTPEKIGDHLKEKEKELENVNKWIEKIETKIKEEKEKREAEKAAKEEAKRVKAEQQAKEQAASAQPTQSEPEKQEELKEEKQQEEEVKTEDSLEPSEVTP